MVKVAVMVTSVGGRCGRGYRCGQTLAVAVVVTTTTPTFPGGRCGLDPLCRTCFLVFSNFLNFSRILEFLFRRNFGYPNNRQSNRGVSLSMTIPYETYVAPNLSLLVAYTVYLVGLHGGINTYCTIYRS